MSNTSVVVTGSSGMIGTAVSKRLLEKGYDVTGVDFRSNRWSDRLDNLTIQTKVDSTSSLNNLPENPEFVLHFGAHSRVRSSIEAPIEAAENMAATTRILRYATQRDANVIFASSREVYGTDNLVLSENDLETLNCRNPYAASKIGSEALISAFQTCYGLKTSILRFSNVYGRYDVSDRVIPLFIAQALDGQDLTVYGKNSVLDFVHIEDCVAGVVGAIESFDKAAGEVFNVASGTGISLLKLAEQVVQIAPESAAVLQDTERKGETNRFVADTSKASAVLGYDPVYSLKDGLKMTAAWYSDRPAVREEILR